MATKPVINVNHAPIAVNNTAVLREDTALTLRWSHFKAFDADRDKMTKIMVSGLSNANMGSLSYYNVTSKSWVTLQQGEAREFTASEVANKYLRYTPAANLAGLNAANINFSVFDGKTYSSNTAALKINITPVNDAPIAQNNTVMIIKNMAGIFDRSDFTFTDVDNATYTRIKITKLESAGALQFLDSRKGWVDVKLNQTFTSAQIDAKQLRFLPATGASKINYADFGFSVFDGKLWSNSTKLTVDVSENVILSSRIKNLTLGSEDNKVFTTLEALKSVQTLNAGGGKDTLIFTDNKPSITASDLTNKSNFEIIQFNSGGSISLSDAFVKSAQNSTIVLNSIDTSQVVFLDASSLTSTSKVFIGTGTFNITPSTHNVVYALDGTDTTLIAGGRAGDTTFYGGTGNDTYTLSGAKDVAYLGEGNDTFICYSLSLQATDILSGGSGIDTIIFMSDANVNEAMLQNKSSIEVIAFDQSSSPFTSMTFSDAFVASAFNSTVEIQNGTRSIQYLNTSHLTNGHRIVLNGSGSVTLADGVDNTLYAKDGVNTTVIGGSGHNTFYGGTGNDTYVLGSGTATVNLGAGFDTVKTSESHKSLDLTQTGGDTLQGIERVDMSDAGANQLIVDAASIARLSDITDTLFVNGNTEDTLIFSNSDWTEGSNQLIDDITYRAFISNTSEKATIYVASDVNITMGLENVAYEKPLSSGADIINLYNGNDIVSTTSANLTSDDIINAGLGKDTISFTDTANIPSSAWANVSGIDVIKLNADNNSLVITNDLVNRSDFHTIEINNLNNSISSLDTSDVRDSNKVYITGVGMVQLADGVNNTVYMKDNDGVLIAGGTGNDTFTLTGSIDLLSFIIKGGANNHTTEFGDTLRLETVNFSLLWDQNILDGQATGIETIDLNNNGNSLSIGWEQILNITTPDPTDGIHKLIIMGGNSSTTHLWNYDGINWSQQSDTTIGGHTFHAYTSNTDTKVSLYIQDSVNFYIDQS